MVSVGVTYANGASLGYACGTHIETGNLYVVPRKRVGIVPVKWTSRELAPLGNAVSRIVSLVFKVVKMAENEERSHTVDVGSWSKCRIPREDRGNVAIRAVDIVIFLPRTRLDAGFDTA